MHLIDRKELQPRCMVLDLDIEVDAASETDDAKVDLSDVATIWCLIRRAGTPVAARFVDVADEGPVTVAALRDWFTQNGDIPAAIVPPPAGGGSMTVAICTRDRRDGLMMTLKSLAQQSNPDFEVLIVDNSPDGGLAGDPIDIPGLNCRVCHEPRPGLSRARNRAVTETRTEFLAWLDDDEVADPNWMLWIKRGFGAACRPSAVAGVMLPAELATPAQVNFERYGGFNKGRGMYPEVLRAGSAAVIDPLLPLPNFGAGGNMAFRTDALRAQGGFDNRLGAGTLTHGGEETRALSLILESGGAILHWPTAVTWHYHRRTDDALDRQFFGYAAGLPAFYMSLLATSPRYAYRLAKLAPRVARLYLDRRRPGNADDLPPDFPRSLLRASRKGLIQGGWLYIREVARQRAEGETFRVTPNCA